MTTVVHDGRRISTHVDLSVLQMPPLHQLRYVRVVGQEELEHEVFSIIGIDPLYVQSGSIVVELVGHG